MTDETRPRFMIAEMTAAEGGKFLRNLCEITQPSGWDNMEAIITQFLTDAYNAGRAHGEDALSTEVKR